MRQLLPAIGLQNGPAHIHLHTCLLSFEQNAWLLNYHLLCRISRKFQEFVRDKVLSAHYVV